MYLPHLLQNSDDSDNIWYIIFWINLPQSNINIFHLTEIMSLYHSKNHRSKWQRPGAQYRPSNAWSLMRRSTVFHWLKYVSKMWPRSPRRTLLGLRSLPNTTTLQGFKSANGNQTNTTNSRAVMLSWLFLGGGANLQREGDISGLSVGECSRGMYGECSQVINPEKHLNCILIVYRVLEAFSLNATLLFTLIIIIIIIIKTSTGEKCLDPHAGLQVSRSRSCDSCDPG